MQEGVTSTPLAGSSFLAVTPSGCFFASAKALDLRTIVFFTAVPNPQQNRFWHGFWSNKLRYLGSRGIYVYKGRISPAGQEKGVDVSIAIDLVRFTYEKAYGVAIIVSADWDFGPAVRLAKQIAKGQGRFLVFESAFPYEPVRYSRRGVPGTKWIHIDRALYDACLDPTDYRVQAKGG